MPPPPQTHALIGATFACDPEALARPLEVLLREALDGGHHVTTEWLPYGAAGDAPAWQRRLESDSATPVDILVLLVRPRDLDVAHPELAAAGDAGHLHRFLQQLQAHDAASSTGATAPPIVVLSCPSPPPDADAALNITTADDVDFERTLDQLSRIQFRSSAGLLRWFTGTPAEWYNAVQDKRTHSPYTASMYHVLVLSIVRQIARVLRRRQPRKKVLVLDCDNTLWGGSVADLGPEGVELSDRFLSLQRFVRRQQEQGMLLCLCSKNIEADVLAVFNQRREEMLLHLGDHIVLHRINWRQKSDNIRELAEELALGLDSFVFVDDNPIECHEVAAALPMVDIVHLPEDFGVGFLDDEWIFDAPITGDKGTAEDRDRTAMYRQNLLRTALQREAGSQSAFLSALGIRIQFDQVAADPASSVFARVLQLHQRTNTFNVATSFSRGLTQERLESYTTNPGHHVLAAHVTDRFGHYGLVCVALCRCLQGSTDLGPMRMVVDSFLLSCRSLNRGVEHAMLVRIAEIADSCGAAEIEIAWEPTERNEPARWFFASLTAVQFVPDQVLDDNDYGDAQAIAQEKTAKLQACASASGLWRVSTAQAKQISFLRDAALASQSPAVSVAAPPSPWFRRAQRLVVEFVSLMALLARRLLPSTAVEWLRLMFAGRTWLPAFDQALPPRVGLLRHRLASLSALDAFMTSRIVPSAPSSAKLSSSTVAQADDVDETDAAFRLRARHATKLELLQHVTDETPRVVWAPSRADDVHVDGERANNVANTAAAPPSMPAVFHRPCATPTCPAVVYWESPCAFRRCRACCYRLQRLLARASATGASVHPRARAAAIAELEKLLHVTLEEHLDSVSPTGDKIWCGAHQNSRKGANQQR